MHITDIINAAEHTANYWLKEGKMELHDGFKIFAHYLRSQHVIEINRKTKKEEKQIEDHNKALRDAMGDHGQG